MEKQNSAVGQNEVRIKAWYDQREWLRGWNVSPHPTINHQMMISQYQKNPDRWDLVFKMLRTCLLTAPEPGKHAIDGENLFFFVNQYETKDPEAVKYETHLKYIDVQYVIDGEELIGIAPSDGTVEVVPYSAENDIAFVKTEKGIQYPATPATFFVFFPGEPHQPGVKSGISQPVRKIVFKIKAE
jgi:YhcH/YjgK/YiaL family protein